MPDICNVPERVVGPYSQTLFLGCSVSNFNCNLGWGADQSTLTVTLVRDTCNHPDDGLHDRLINIPIDIITSQPETTPSTAFYGIGNLPDPIVDPGADRSKTLYRNIAENMKQTELEREIKNRNLPPEWQNIGKRVPGVYNDRSKVWTGADPGFLGLMENRFSSGLGVPYGFDILGTPVVFRFNDFHFGGLVSSWQQNGGSSAVSTFEVEIKSFSSLLNGCQLIIDKYAGTMCGIVHNGVVPMDPMPAIPVSGLAMPVPYAVDTSTNPTSFRFYDHRANINQGNLPNVFNIYGYLEYLGYKRKVFGNAGVNDDGMRAQFIYDALVGMLGSPNNVNNPEMNRFAPYGGILTRTIRTENSLEINPSVVNFNGLTLTDMGICHNVMAQDNFRRCRLLLDISEVPRPPRWLRFQGPVITIMQFISEVCDGSGFDFFVDFVATAPGDPYSGIIKIRTVSRRKQPRKNQIDALIADAANRLGVSSYSKGKEYADTSVRSMYVGANQKRLLQFKNTRLAFRQNSLIYDPWANGGIGHWIDYAMDASQLPSTPNQLREPNPMSTRRYAIRNLGGGAAVWSDSVAFNNNTHFTSPSSSRPLTQGNYNTAVNLSNGAMFQEAASPDPRGDIPDLGDAGGYDLGDLYNTNTIALYLDTICPFFGTGFGGLVRKVFFDTGMGQMQIIFYVQDIQSLTDLPFTTYDPYPSFNESTGAPSAGIGTAPVFMVLENEIRAAGAGFASWLSYCFGNIFTTDIAQLIYKGFRAKYGFGNGSNNIRLDFLIGMQNIMLKAYNKNLIVNGRQMQVSLDDLNPYIKTLYHDLEKIHQFFANIANQYYGKKYMIRGPSYAYYTDISYVFNNNNDRIMIGRDENNNPIYAIEGTGKVYPNYSPSADGAWEEPGNFIDDTMIIGGVRASAFADESGKIPCILGFNASAEKENRRLWERMQALYYASLRRFSDSPTSHTIIDYEFVHERMLNDPILNGNHYYMSVNHSLSPDEHMLMPYLSTSVNWSTAHGENIPSDRKYKLYVRATPEQSVQFLEPYSIGPRIVVTISAPVYVGQGRNATDQNLDAVMAQDAIFFLMKGPRIPLPVQGVPATPEPFGSFGNGVDGINISRNRTVLRGFSPNPLGGVPNLDYCGTIFNLAYFHQNAPIGTADENKPSVLQKAAMPMFCALPIEYHNLVYGPWINHPGLISANIFPDSFNPRLDVENLIGGVKVNIDPNLAPWNFGGMTQLDDAVMLKIADDVNYQQFLEKGTVQIPGLDGLSLGTIIRYFGNLFDGPIVNSIQVQIGDNGVTTTYNFRTYTRKLGLFNKENADRIKAIGQESIKRNKEISQKIMSLASRIGVRII